VVVELKEDEVMKKLITGVVLGAMCCVLFSTPAVSIKYNPNNPVHQTHDTTGNSTADEIPWTEPLQASSVIGNGGFWQSLFSQNLFLHVIWIESDLCIGLHINPNIETQDNERNSDAQVIGNCGASGK
jgi:hypothetical protein